MEPCLPGPILTRLEVQEEVEEGPSPGLAREGVGESRS